MASETVRAFFYVFMFFEIKKNMTLRLLSCCTRLLEHCYLPHVRLSEAVIFDKNVQHDLLALAKYFCRIYMKQLTDFS